jgi:hypothetical protein
MAWGLDSNRWKPPITITNDAILRRTKGNEHMNVGKVDIIEIKEAAKHDWLPRKGVTGMDVGLKYIAGKRTGEVAIRLFVRKKVSDIAPEKRFPSQLGKHKTDVIVREFKPNSNLPDEATYNPMVGGIELFSGERTTAGMFVRDNVTGQLMILGTFHGHIPPNTPIYQPQSGTQIGYLIRGGHYLTQPLDADLILFGAPRGYHLAITELGPIKGVRDVSVADLGKLLVRKRGFWTGWTNGLLEGVKGTTKSGIVYEDTYDLPDYQGRDIYYENGLSFVVDTSDPNHIYREPGDNTPLFGHKGDSGSIILDKDNNAVALMAWAGTAGGTGVGGGPPAPDLMAQLNVTPCFQGVPLPESIVLTSEEEPLEHHPYDNGVWDQSSSGMAAGGLFSWTLKNTYQRLIFRATVVGFDQPVFTWSIRDWNPPNVEEFRPLNDFSNSGEGYVTVYTPVTAYHPSDPVPSTKSIRPATLFFTAQHGASYGPKGTYSELTIEPTVVEGSMTIMVQVEVRSTMHASAAVRGWSNPSQIASGTLDTQEVTYQPITGARSPSR